MMMETQPKGRGRGGAHFELEVEDRGHLTVQEGSLPFKGALEWREMVRMTGLCGKLTSKKKKRCPEDGYRATEAKKEPRLAGPIPSPQHPAHFNLRPPPSSSVSLYPT
jgi:hypothetical protein